MMIVRVWKIDFARSKRKKKNLLDGKKHMIAGVSAFFILVLFTYGESPWHQNVSRLHGQRPAGEGMLKAYNITLSVSFVEFD